MEPFGVDSVDGEPRPLFSIIIPTFNRAEMLAEAVESVLQQSITDFELLVVDDHSTEPAAVPSDPRVRLIRQATNQGIAAARNAGIAAARGRYVAFLDDDDCWAPERLEMALDAHRRAPVAICWAAWMGSCHRGAIIEGVQPEALLSGVTPHLGATSVRREEVERFDTRYTASEDVEWWIRMSNRAVATTPAVGCWLRRRAADRVGYGAEARIEGSLLAMDEHASFFSAHPRAASARWQRIGLQYLELEQRRDACLAFTRAFTRKPNVRPLVHLARTIAGCVMSSAPHTRITDRRRRRSAEHHADVGGASPPRSP